LNTGSRREAVQIKHPASDDASQLNVNVESAGDVFAVENIHKSFGENEVLKGISLAAKKHQVISILGSSGYVTCARTEGEQLFGTAAQASLIG
jgi:ATPase subunit of ABC transporter with duplicated ATPase domains